MIETTKKQIMKNQHTLYVRALYLNNAQVKQVFEECIQRLHAEHGVDCLGCQVYCNILENPNVPGFNYGYVWLTDALVYKALLEPEVITAPTMLMSEGSLFDEDKDACLSLLELNDKLFGSNKNETKPCEWYTLPATSNVNVTAAAAVATPTRFVEAMIELEPYILSPAELSALQERFSPEDPEDYFIEPQQLIKYSACECNGPSHPNTLPHVLMAHNVPADVTVEQIKRLVSYMASDTTKIISFYERKDRAHTDTAPLVTFHTKRLGSSASHGQQQQQLNDLTVRICFDSNTHDGLFAYYMIRKLKVNSTTTLFFSHQPTNYIFGEVIATTTKQLQATMPMQVVTASNDENEWKQAKYRHSPRAQPQPQQRHRRKHTGFDTSSSTDASKASFFESKTDQKSISEGPKTSKNWTSSSGFISYDFVC